MADELFWSPSFPLLVQYSPKSNGQWSHTTASVTTKDNNYVFPEGKKHAIPISDLIYAT